MAEHVVYGDLPTTVAVEKPEPVNTCADDNRISKRMLKVAGADWSAVRGRSRTCYRVIEEQLAKAGTRLAAVLNSIWL